MYNKVVKELVYEYERLNDWYEIGPVQKAVLEDFVEKIVMKCAGIVKDANTHKLPASSYADLILEDFNMKE